jgi:hypothetical protein
MQLEDEIRELREALEPAMRTCGRIVDNLDDEQFSARLRRCLMMLTGPENGTGFDYASARTPAGDYLVTLVWSEAAGKVAPKTSVGFSAHGATETLAFLRAAQKVLKHPEYRDLLFQSSHQ